MLPSYIDTHLTTKKLHRFRKEARERIIQEVMKINGLI
jgi:hypothetical protein